MKNTNPNQNYVPPASVNDRTPLHTPEIAPRIPAKASPTEFITIPVAEYMYLHRLDALMDVLLLDSAYSSAHTIQAVKDTVLSMRMAKGAGAEE